MSNHFGPGVDCWHLNSDYEIKRVRVSKNLTTGYYEVFDKETLKIIIKHRSELFLTFEQARDYLKECT